MLYRKYVSRDTIATGLCTWDENIFFFVIWLLTIYVTFVRNNQYLWSAQWNEPDYFFLEAHNSTPAILVRKI